MALLQLPKPSWAPSYKDLFRIDSLDCLTDASETLYSSLLSRMERESSHCDRQWLQTVDVRELRTLLGQCGFVDQQKYIKNDSDVRDFIFGMCFRVEQRKLHAANIDSSQRDGFLHVQDSSNQASLCRLFESISMASDKVTSLLTNYKKISYYYISNLTIREQRSYFCPVIENFNQITPKKKADDLLYGLIWLEEMPQRHGMSGVYLWEEGPRQEKTPGVLDTRSHPISPLETTGPHKQQGHAVELTPGDAQSVQRTLQFPSTENSNQSHTSQTVFKGIVREIGHAEPGRCPAVLQLSGKVCNKTTPFGPYCSRHRQTHPRVKSSRDRMFLDMKNNVDMVLRRNGYDELIQSSNEDFIITLQHIVEEMIKRPPPWEDFSSTFHESDSFYEISGHYNSVTYDSHDEVTSPETSKNAYMVTFNIQGDRSNAQDKSHHLRDLLKNTGASAKIIFLQEVHTKGFIQGLKKGCFYQEKQKDPLLKHYQIVHRDIEQKSMRDTCILYDSTYFEASDAMQEMQVLTRHQAFNLRSVKLRDRLQTRFSAIKLTTRQGLRASFLAVSFHGFKSADKVSVNGYESLEAPIIDLFERVHRYIDTHKIPAIIGGDFNKSPGDIEELLERNRFRSTDVYHPHDPSDRNIDFFVITYPANHMVNSYTIGTDERKVTALMWDGEQTMQHPPVMAPCIVS